MCYSLKILGNLIEKRRIEMRFTRKDIAVMLGFKNLGRAIWLIDQIERGKNYEKLIPRICELLKITELDLKRCETEEYRLIREYRASLPPFKPHIVIRYGACIYVKTAIPSNVDPLNYLAYTVALSKEKNLEMCLQLSYELRCWVKPDETHSIGQGFGNDPSPNLIF